MGVHNSIGISIVVLKTAADAPEISQTAVSDFLADSEEGATHGRMFWYLKIRGSRNVEKYRGSKLNLPIRYIGNRLKFFCRKGRRDVG